MSATTVQYDYDFSVCKNCEHQPTEVKYKVRGFEIHVCPQCGSHYINYLDTIESDDTPSKMSPAKQKKRIESDLRILEHNRGKFEAYTQLTNAENRTGGHKVLDVGCGYGRFLNSMKAVGYEGMGIEPIPYRRAYCKETNLDVTHHLIDDPFWDQYENYFDIVTLWDVIEHVNFPAQTVKSIFKVVKPGGIFVLATPTRDALFHKVGVTTYHLSGGKYPSFLGVMYNDVRFGHKQIFSDNELVNLMKQTGFREAEVRRKFELSFPFEVYLKKLFHNNKPLVNATLPVVTLLVNASRIKNKVFVIAQK